MTDAEEEQVIQVGTVLAQLASDIASGSRRDASTIARDLGTLISVLLPVDALKQWLGTVDAAETDRFLDLVTTAKLGPRP